MKRCLSFIFAGLLMASIDVAAEDVCCNDQEWTISADYLYWTTRRCDLDFAIPYDEGTSNSLGSVHAVDPHYDHGFRVGLEKSCGDTGFGVNYTNFQTDAKSVVTEGVAGNLAGTWLIDNTTVLTQGVIPYASGAWDLDYQVLALLGYYGVHDDCYQVAVFGGPKFALIDERFDIVYASALDITDAGTNRDDLHNKIDLTAYGFSVGGRADIQICGCLGFLGSLAYDVFVADIDRREIYLNSTNGGAAFTTRIDLTENCWRTLTVVNLAVGLQYEPSCFSCLHPVLAVGYEFQHWINYPGYMVHQNESGEITFDRRTENMGFDGLFACLALSF